MPYDFSGTAQNDPAALEDLVGRVASQLERHRLARSEGSPSEATCSGLRAGTEWTARATDARCRALTEITYRCTVTDAPTRALWLRTESIRRDVDADLASYCG
jgi:hypothetical protein